MEYQAVQSFLMVLLAICSSVVCIGGAVAAIVKFWKWAHKDTDKNTEDIGEFRKWLASDKHRIEDLEGDFDEIIEQNNLLIKAVMAIMDHQIDGNNTERLKETRGKLDNYLVEANTTKRKRREAS